MSSSEQIKVFGKTFTVKNLSSQIELDELSEYVNAKMNELSRSAGKNSTLDLAILTSVSIALEYLELKKGAERDEEIILQKTSELVETIHLELESSTPPKGPSDNS